MQEILRTYPHVAVNLKQVQNYMNRRRLSVSSVTGDDLSSGAFHEWAQGRELNANSDPNAVSTVPGFVINEDKVLIGLTTAACIRSAHDAQQANDGYMLLGVDCTYSLTLHNYPVQVLVDIDRNGRANVLALFIQSGEDQEHMEDGLRGLSRAFELVTGQAWSGPVDGIADYAQQIRLALQALFPGINIGQCYFHQGKALKANKGKFTSDEDYEDFRADVQLLHTMTDTQAFVVGLELHLRRWDRRQPEATQWFRTYWAQPGHREWHAGATAWGSPAVNNATESFNRILKAFATRRKRASLGVCLRMLVGELEYQSAMTPSRRSFLPLPTRREWHAAQDWVEQHRDNVVRRPNETFLVPSSRTSTRPFLEAGGRERAVIVRQWLTRRRDAWRPRETVATFVARHQMFYVVTPQQQPLAQPAHPHRIYMCTCANSFKYGRCKHALALAILNGHVNVPANQRLAPPPTLPARGRPRNAAVQQPTRRNRRRTRR